MVDPKIWIINYYNISSLFHLTYDLSLVFMLFLPTMDDLQFRLFNHWIAFLNAIRLLPTHHTWGLKLFSFMSFNYDPTMIRSLQ